MIERYQVILAYDGTGFKGFQKQARARTVQAVVEEALHELGWQGKSILGAGRTDTGVHAVGQVIAFDLDWVHGTQDLLNALNANLPPDVAARNVFLAAPNFHPRFDAYSRSYRYSLFCDPVPNPIQERYAWRVWPAVDFERLNQCAERLKGRHIFGAFGSPPHSRGTTIRIVYHSVWVQEGPMLVFEITANAFLYHMVRRLVAVQVEIVQRNWDSDDMRMYMESDTKPPQGLAPANGLVLAEVSYPSYLVRKSE
ncbi:MAG: tRNA pseudouridine(38-40) synthase TruA [Chloroflexi bacterium]|nr:MAG: tRNA pseudouridine(38-40) synthase TruA [Chloroflexota bacterium]